MILFSYETPPVLYHTFQFQTAEKSLPDVPDNHLSLIKAPPDFSHEVLDEVVNRLNLADMR